MLYALYMSPNDSAVYIAKSEDVSKNSFHYESRTSMQLATTAAAAAVTNRNNKAGKIECMVEVWAKV